jgi:hypothetical protein
MASNSAVSPLAKFGRRTKTISGFKLSQQIVLTNMPEDQFPEHFSEDGYSMIVADG